MLVFYANKDFKQFSRSFYNSLDFLGDIGGLIDGLRLIGGFLLIPMGDLPVIVNVMRNLYFYSAETDKEHDGFRNDLV